MLRMNRSIFTILLSFFCTMSFGQGTTFRVSDDLKFLNFSGDTMQLALLGGFNQPQFQSIDIDNDGTHDLFVYDRTGDKVMSLIADGSGNYTYRPEYDHIFPTFTSWVAFKDYNNDGKEDLWFRNYLVNGVSLYRNITQPNDPHIRFEVAKNILRAYNFGQIIDTSDIYADAANIPAIEDVDGDGDIDFLTLQTIGFGVTLFLNNTVENDQPLDPPAFEEIDVCWGDFTEGTSSNQIILERYQFCYRKYYRYLKHAGGSSMLLLDGDDDGDMDLILGNAGFNNLIYLENGKTDLGMKLDSMIAYDARFPFYDIPARVNTFPASFMLDVDQDGKKDLLVSPNLTDKFSGYIAEYDNVLYYKNTGTASVPKFIQQDSTWMNDQMIDMGSHTVPLFYDYDGDGDQDIISATNQGHLQTADKHDALYLYENVGSPTKAIYKLIDKDFLGLDKDSISGMHPTIGDLNNDGDPELLIGHHSGSLILYDLSGKGNSMTATLISKNAFSINVGYTAAPHIGDVDEDGIDDLLIGCVDGNVFYYHNQPVNNVADLTLVDDSLGGIIINELRPGTWYDQAKDTFIDTLLPVVYGYSSPFLADLDGNGKKELIVGGAGGNIKAYRDISKDLSSDFIEYPLKYYSDHKSMDLCYEFDAGGEVKPTVADVNDDGRPDVLVGNDRGGFIFYEHQDNECVVSAPTIPHEHEFTIYPNPSTGAIKLNSPFSGKRVVRVSSVDGKEVFNVTTSSDSVDLSNLRKGLYFIDYQFPEVRFRGKIILE